MSAVDEDEVILCASCGVAAGDDITLKVCTACHLVKYCSVKCQKDHRLQHKRECKKRAAELKDAILFKQPESSHLGDCPICCLPLPIDPSKSNLMSCCSKVLCEGCDYANQMREFEGRHQHKCAFCRKPLPKTKEEVIGRLTKRIEVNDPVAICDMGMLRCDEGDYEAAFEYWTRAAALGDVTSHYQLSCLYHDGLSVEKDEKRKMHHTEQAAIGGHPEARHNLGCMEAQNGQRDRALKHYTIAANLGDNDSLEAVKKLYKTGLVSKDDFAAALRGYQTAIEATKSPQRKEAAKLMMQLRRKKGCVSKQE